MIVGCRPRLLHSRENYLYPYSLPGLLLHLRYPRPWLWEVLWVVMLCSLEVYWHFGGSCCLHHQCRRASHSFLHFTRYSCWFTQGITPISVYILTTIISSAYASALKKELALAPKRQWQSYRPHGVKSKKTIIFIVPVLTNLRSSLEVNEILRNLEYVFSAGNSIQTLFICPEHFESSDL